MGKATETASTKASTGKPVTEKKDTEKGKAVAEKPKPDMTPTEAPGSVIQGGALAKNEPQASALTKSAAALAEEDAGQGTDFGKDDITIPRIVILQGLSPQCTKGDPEYIKEAQPGMLFDTVNRVLFDGDEGILIVPTTYRRAFIEWKLRKDGGGFVKDWGTDDAILKTTTEEEGRAMTAHGTEIVPTAEYFVLLWDPNTSQPIPMVLSFAKTAMKAAKRWNTLISQLRVPKSDGSGTFNPAIFFRAYKLTTVPESNDKGSWMAPNITPDVNTVDLGGSLLYMRAKEFREQVMGGKVKAAQPDAANPTGTGAQGEEIPF